MAAGWLGVGTEDGGDPGLHRFRDELASLLAMPAIGVGRDRAAVLAAFQRQITIRGKAEVLALCAEAAEHIEGNGHGRPANLAAFTGWLATRPLPK